MGAVRRHAHVAGAHLGVDVGRRVEDDGEAVGVHVLHVGPDDERLGARDRARQDGAGERHDDCSAHQRLRVAMARRRSPAALASSITATTRP